MPTLDVFVKVLLERFSGEITDKVFLMIQNDRELMQEYLHLVHENGVKAVNTFIGKEVKSKYKLVNQSARQEEPKSILIKSHQIFD